MTLYLVLAVGTIILCLLNAPLSSGLNLLPTLAPLPKLFPTATTVDPNRETPPETSMTTPQIITYHGYPVEEHHVRTDDGYILTVFRIPHGKTNRNMTKNPVIIQHGLMASSSDWLLVPPTSILPYLLVEDGHEVWLGNARGNDYSMGHETLSPSTLEFWNFSSDEMGVYDVPAVINHVLHTTGKEQVSYVGHSLGTVMFYIAMDRRPELQAKVTRMVALASGPYLSHTKSPVLRSFALAPSPVLLTFSDVLSGGRVAPTAVQKWLNQYSGQICSEQVPAFFCKNFLFLVSGYDPSELTTETTSKVFGHLPSTTSIRVFDHSLQFIRRGLFQEYGNKDQPLYNLTVNRVPTLVMYGENDWLATPKDVLRSVSELGNVVQIVRVNYSKFGHLDFTYAKHVKSLVYDRCVSFLST